MFRLCSPEGVPALVKLASRETQLILLACGGMTDKEIAKALSISIGTVITLWSTIRGKLGISSRAAAVAGIAWAVAKLESRNVPELDDTSHVDSSAVEPAILILGKQQVVLMCNAVAATMFDTTPGMTLDKSPRLARALTDNDDSDSDAGAGFPWSRPGSHPAQIEEVMQIANPGGTPRQIVVSCTFAEDHVFGRVAVLRVLPSNHYAITDRQSSEGPPEGKGRGRPEAAVQTEPPSTGATRKAPTEELDLPDLPETPFALGRVEDVPQFAAMVAQDLEGPLRALSCLSKILSTDHADELSEEGKRRLDQIRAQASHLAKVLESVAGYAEIDSASRKTSTVEMSSFIEDIAAKADVPVAVDVDTFACEVDAEALATCLRGLLENAVRRAGEKPAIRISGKRAGDRCRIQVSDNGESLAVENLFDAIELRGNRQSGSSIGATLLSLSVVRLGGTITPESGPGEGATFTLDIPCLAVVGIDPAH